MARYAEIEGGLVVGTKAMASNFVAADVRHKTDWRIVNQLADPAYDPATHKLGPVEYTVFADRIESIRTVVPLTQPEIDAKAAALALTTDHADIGVGTLVERIERIERILSSRSVRP